MSDLSIEIKEIDDNNIDGTDVNIDNGKPITKIEVSPNEEYLVIYNQEDQSIVCWNISDKKKHNTVDGIKNLDKICVSDDKKLVYIYNNKPRIIDMNNNTQEIKLYYDESIYKNHCTFNVKGEFIICNNVSNQKILRIYSTQTKNNKWKCKHIYKIPQYYELINISKYNKLYLLLRNCIYECDIVTEKIIRIFADEDDEEIEKRDIRISSNERFICLRIKYEKMNDEKFEDEKFNDKKDLKDKIIIYSIELEIHIAALKINDDISLYDIMKHIDLTLYPLLFTLFDRSSEIWNSIMKYYWKICLDGSNGNHHLSKEYRPAILSNNIQITTKYAFGILDGDFLKIKFEEKLSLENYDKSCHENDKTIIECWNMYLNSDGRDNTEVTKDTFKHLKILLFNPYKDTLCALFREVKKVMDDVSQSDYPSKYEDELIHNTIKWKIKINDVKILLQVFKRNDDSSKWSSICKRIEKHNFGKGCLLGTKLIDNNDIVILTNIGLFIYYFNGFNISLNYFYHMDLNNSLSQDYENKFSKITLPLPSINSFKLNGWALNLANNKLSLLKYGVELLKFAIKVHNLELIEYIYKNSMNYFKQDLRNNKIFLSIITSNMPLLKNYFSGYIERYSLETDLIIDDSSYSICHNNANPFQVVSLTGTRKSYEKFHRGRKNPSEYISTPTEIQKITFMVPFIKFFNYPQDYKWWKDLFLPQPNPFVETLSNDIYKTMSGRAIYTFKWRSYGYFYYVIIMIGHALLAMSFAIASVLNHDYEAYRKVFLWISIILGFIHLFFILRQFIYRAHKYRLYELSPLYLFGIALYPIMIYISARLLRTSETSDITSTLSFLCLLLFFKTITYLRIVNFYAKYYIIVVRVAENLMFFFCYFILVVLLSFAFAFYVLLSPKLSYSLDERIINDDPNNPWNLIPTYQVYENETSNVLNNNLFILQKPDENTNKFTNFSTSFFATSLLLTGDTSSFSNWPFIKNPALVILMSLFVFFMVIYIINVFITLYGEVNDGRDDILHEMWKMRAEIVSEIELFYLLPSQRRCQKWFPEVLYFDLMLGEAQEIIKELISEGKLNTNEFPEMKQYLLNKLKIQHN